MLRQDGPIVFRDLVACLPISYSSKLKRPVDFSIMICVMSNHNNELPLNGDVLHSSTLQMNLISNKMGIICAHHVG